MTQPFQLGNQQPSISYESDGAQYFQLGNSPARNIGNIPGQPGMAPPTFMEKTFGRWNPETRTMEPGLFQPITQGISAIGNLGLGIKQLGMAEDAYKHTVEMDNRNFDMNQNTLAFNIGNRAEGAAKLNNATDAEAAQARKNKIEQSGVFKV